MTVIRPNGISGITSITSSGDAINFYKSDGTLGPVLGLNINATTGISTFAALNVTGVLTYEDVTSVDSVGIITARSDLSIADKIIHTGDTNTAIRFPAADTVTVETGGNERVRVTSAGNFGIGVTPNVKLHVKLDTNKHLYFQGNIGEIGSVPGIQGVTDAGGLASLGLRGSDLRFATGSAERVRIDSSGRLLLGTSTEGYSTSDDLTIATSGSTGMTIRSGTSNFGSIHFSDATSGTGEYAGVLEYAHANDSLAFYTSATRRLTIDSSGRLMIGTTTEGAANADNLTIADSGHAGITIRSGTSSNASVFFSDATSGSGEYEGVIEYQHSNNDMVFFTSGSEALRIDSNGNIGINENSPSSFDSGARDLVVGNSGNAGILIKGGTSSYSNLYFGDGIGSASYRGFIAYNHSEDSLRLGAAGQERMRITSSGQMGLGTNNPVQQSGTGLHIHNAGGQTRIKLTNNITGATANDGFDIIQEHNNDVHILNHEAGVLKFGTNDAERMRINSAGNMGLGTSSINNKLVIASSGNNPAYFHSVNGGTGGSGNDGIVMGMGSATDAYFWNYESGRMVFATSATERMRIDSSGHVQIGATTSDSFRLKVLNGAGTLARFTDGTSQTLDIRQATGGIELQNPNNGFISFKGSSVERMRIRANGNVILGPYRAPAAYGTVTHNVPYEIKVAPYGWQNGSEIASISMGSHHGTGQDDGQIVFKTAADVHSTTNGLQERARILSTGGLTFNGDVAQANALDDYEEGSWTPTLAKAGTSGTVASPNNAFGSYRKIGSLLWISFYWYKASGTFGTTTGQWYVMGLPYNLITLANSAYQFVPGGYMSINGKTYNLHSSTTGASGAGGHRWQSNAVNGAASLSLYGVEHNTNWSSGGLEFSGCGVLMTT